MTPGTRSRVIGGGAGLLTLCTLLLVSSAPSANTYVGYPSSIAVLGHSGATGENSDPTQPGVEVRANSWATGTNPAVNSVYLRILAKNPAIKGHNVNLARGSATVHVLVRQAQRAVALEPKPDLILIQIMDADMVCPAKASDYAAFRSTFVSALKLLAQGAPESSIFVVSQFGSSPERREDAQPCRTQEHSAAPGRVPSSIPKAGSSRRRQLSSRRSSMAIRRSSKPAASSSRSAGTTAALSAGSSTSARTGMPVWITSRSRATPRQRPSPGRR